MQYINGYSHLWNNVSTWHLALVSDIMLRPVSSSCIDKHPWAHSKTVANVNETDLYLKMQCRNFYYHRYPGKLFITLDVDENSLNFIFQPLWNIKYLLNMKPKNGKLVYYLGLSWVLKCLSLPLWTYAFTLFLSLWIRLIEMKFLKDH